MSNLFQPPALRNGRMLFVCSMHVTRCVCVCVIAWVSLCSHLIRHGLGSNSYCSQIKSLIWKSGPVPFLATLGLMIIPRHLKIEFFNPQTKNFEIFPHESLLNLCASKVSQNSTEFLCEICGQFSCMIPYWIGAHLKLFKIRHEALMKCVDIFAAQILTEFVGI